VPQLNVANIDTFGFFTVTLNIPDGVYNWRIKGTRHLANAGNLTITAGSSNQEMGTMRGGDSVTSPPAEDNLVSAADFNNLKAAFGILNPPDLSSDFNFDGQVSAADFNILSSNFGTTGAPVNCP